MQNTAGQWVTPAFQLHLKALDAIEPLPAAANIRQPRVPAAMTPTSTAVESLPAAVEALRVGEDGKPVVADRSKKRFTHVVFDVRTSSSSPIRIRLRL